MDENALTADDILPESQNGSANYLLVPAFGAVGPRRPYRGLMLANELRRTIRENFFEDRTRRLTLIATGFSRSGRRIAERRARMDRLRYIDFDGKECPLFSRPITYEDVA